MKKNIVVIDYDIGNVTSVANAVDLLGYNVKISREENKLRNADFLILPGVGAFEEGMKNLIKYNLVALLNQIVLIEKKPILGICLGMQLMADTSDEMGKHAGLGWINGDVKVLDIPESFRVPHVGWNNITCKKRVNELNRLSSSPDFYFDHSYHYVCKNSDDVLAVADYGIEITAAINKKNIWGVQFHPEKSQNNGLKLFRGLIEAV